MKVIEKLPQKRKLNFFNVAGEKNLALKSAILRACYCLHRH